MNECHCPLCGGKEHSLIHCRNQEYQRCQACQMVWLEKRYHLQEQDEKAIYDLHQNQTDDLGYRRFLQRSLEQVQHHLAPPAAGLDFGCGPGPALIQMAEELGYPMQAYDKYYAPNLNALQQDYDFVTCTEVVEHLSAPLLILDQLWQITRPGGLIVIQTKRVLDDQRFCQWHYRNDPTHITFFSETSFHWLANRWQCAISLPHNDVVVFYKP